MKYLKKKKRIYIRCVRKQWARKFGLLSLLCQFSAVGCEVYFSFYILVKLTIETYRIDGATYTIFMSSICYSGTNIRNKLSQFSMLVLFIF